MHWYPCLWGVDQCIHLLMSMCTPGSHNLHPQGETVVPSVEGPTWVMSVEVHTAEAVHWHSHFGRTLEELRRSSSIRTRYEHAVTQQILQKKPYGISMECSGEPQSRIMQSIHLSSEEQVQAAYSCRKQW